MNETPYMAQRRTLRELKDKQDDGGPIEASHHAQISPKAAARRAVEAEAKAHHPVFASSHKKKAKKAGKVSTD